MKNNTKITIRQLIQNIYSSEYGDMMFKPSCDQEAIFALMFELESVKYDYDLFKFNVFYMFLFFVIAIGLVFLILFQIK